MKRGNRARVQTEIIKFIALPLPFSSKLEIWLSILRLRLCANGRNIVGQQPPTLWMLHVASVCTPCCMLLDVVACCCTKFETGRTFSPEQTDATLLANNSQHCWELLRPFACSLSCAETAKKLTKKMCDALAKLLFCFLLCSRYRCRLSFIISLMILDSTPWIPDSRCWIPDFLSVELGFRIAVFSGIPDSNAVDSGLQSRGFRIP